MTRAPGFGIRTQGDAIDNLRPDPDKIVGLADREDEGHGLVGLIGRGVLPDRPSSRVVATRG
ncbi:MAG: hypothetical protein J4G15_02000 [Alphaproteobacteria bacterium]|nr:hypothetical protein [Alphaproteobacteria bacterium]